MAAKKNSWRNCWGEIKTKILADLHLHIATWTHTCSVDVQEMLYRMYNAVVCCMWSHPWAQRWPLARSGLVSVPVWWGRRSQLQLQKLELQWELELHYSLFLPKFSIWHLVSVFTIAELYILLSVKGHNITLRSHNMYGCDTQWPNAMQSST